MPADCGSPKSPSPVIVQDVFAHGVDHHREHVGWSADVRCGCRVFYAVFHHRPYSTTVHTACGRIARKYIPVQSFATPYLVYTSNMSRKLPCEMYGFFPSAMLTKCFDWTLKTLATFGRLPRTQALNLKTAHRMYILDGLREQRQRHCYVFRRGMGPFWMRYHRTWYLVYSIVTHAALRCCTGARV